MAAAAAKGKSLEDVFREYDTDKKSYLSYDQVKREAAGLGKGTKGEGCSRVCGQLHFR